MPFAQAHSAITAIIVKCLVPALLLLAAIAFPKQVAAQSAAEGERAAEGEESNEPAAQDTIVAPPGAVLAQASDPYDTYAVRHAEDQVKRARNGLIATSVAFGVGWVFIGAASSQCNRDASNAFVCNDAGRALGTIGMISAGGGLIGMIVTGILLPVRQKKERDLRRSIHQRQPARLRWDVRSGGVAF